jgi:hypothetical protein
VQRFRSQLTHELDALHKTVSTSVTQQEDHLKQMEDDMKSFVSSKDEAIQFPPRFCTQKLILCNCYVRVYMTSLSYPFLGCTRAKGEDTKFESPTWFRYYSA